jgi:hypothetical protein
VPGLSESASHTARRRYKDLSGNSGVLAYEPRHRFIRIWFVGGDGYEYDETKPGKRDVDAMKRLAQAGRGLATYINRHVRNNFAQKL